MDIVKAFNSNDLHTEIIIKGTVNDPLFRASDIGVVLELSNIRMSIADFDESEKVVSTTDTLGGTQEVTFLTEKGLYKVLFRSRKPIAQKFQNWVCDVIKEIRVTGIYNMQKEIDKKQEELEEKQEELEEKQEELEKTKDEMASLEDTKKKEYETKLEKEKVLEREKILLKEYDTACSIVYIIRVKTLEHVGKYIIKIGESRRGISGRYNEHKSKYEECVLLDCFCVHRSKDFENFIHNHESVRLNRVTDLKNHEKEHELFLIGRNLSYQTLHQIITSNMKNFNDVNTSSLELEIEKLKLLIQMKEDKNENGLLHELVNSVKQLSGKVDANEKMMKEMMEKMSASKVKTTTGFNTTLVTLGPRLQKIHPDTLELVKVYESVSEAMKENPDIKRPSMNKAVRENTVYHGYRWLLVDRDLDASVVHGTVLPTKKVRPQVVGYIAQLNGDKTKILNVYIDRKTAAHCNGYESSGLDVPVKKSTISRGFYYKLYDDCDEELRTTFELERNNGECPLLYRNGVGQYDAQGNLVQVHACKYDCIRTLKISDKTLAKALLKKIDYNGFYFKEIGEKLKC
jgi:prophage antirepressor-like protein